MDTTQYTPQEINLAQDIAETLHDPEALPLYLQYARKYKEEFLRRRLERVMRVEAEKIKTSRGALFTYLIKQATDDSRD